MAKIDIEKGVAIYEQLKALGIIDLILGLFKKKPKPIPAPPATPVAPPVPGAPAPTPILPAPVVPVVAKVASVRLEIQKAERPDMSVTPRRQDPGNLYPDPMGMIARDEAFNYGASFWANATLYDASGDPIEDQEIIDANLEFRGEHRIYNDATGELVAYFKGEGDTLVAGEGEPVPYHTWSIPGIRLADSSWRKSAGLNARFMIEIEGRWRFEFRTADGIVANTFTLRTS